MAVAPDARTSADVPADPVGAVPREYNFAADIIGRNLKAGRADKPVYIDPRGAWTYGQLADGITVVRHAAQYATVAVVLSTVIFRVEKPTCDEGV